jgi:hypothetical protein
MPKHLAPTSTPVRSQSSEEAQRKRNLQVKMMASTKTQISAMADVLGISVFELRRKYRKEMNNGHDYVYAQVSMRLVNSALGGDIRAMLAWLRQYGGWQEISRRELTGKNGEPITFRNLDSTSILAVIEALGKTGNPGRGRGRNGPQIDARAGEVIDMDTISGPTDEGFEE